MIYKISVTKAKVNNQWSAFEWLPHRHSAEGEQMLHNYTKQHSTFLEQNCSGNQSSDKVPSQKKFILNLTF